MVLNHQAFWTVKCRINVRLLQYFRRPLDSPTVFVAQLGSQRCKSIVYTVEDITYSFSWGSVPQVKSLSGGLALPCLFVHYYLSSTPNCSSLLYLSFSLLPQFESPKQMSLCWIGLYFHTFLRLISICLLKTFPVPLIRPLFNQSKNVRVPVHVPFALCFYINITYVCSIGPNIFFKTPSFG